MSGVDGGAVARLRRVDARTRPQAAVQDCRDRTHEIEEADTQHLGSQLSTPAAGIGVSKGWSGSEWRMGSEARTFIPSLFAGTGIARSTRLSAYPTPFATGAVDVGGAPNHFPASIANSTMIGSASTIMTMAR
jgi:hypothetical protein